MKPKILLCDFQDLSRIGTRSIIQLNKEVELVAETKDFASALKELAEQKIDVLIIDYERLPHFSEETFQHLTQTQPLLKVMIVSADNKVERIMKVLEAGVLSFVTKTCSLEEINNALLFTLKGQKFFCNKILELLLNARLGDKSAQLLDESKLTSREVEIVQMIADGFSTSEIADKVSLSPHTINAYRKILLKKLDSPTPVGMVAKAFRLGLIQ